MDILSDGTDFFEASLPCAPWEDPANVAAHVVMSVLLRLKASRRKRVARTWRVSGRGWDDHHHKHHSEIASEVRSERGTTACAALARHAVASQRKRAPVSHHSHRSPARPRRQVRELKQLELELPAELDLVLSCCVEALEAHQLVPGDGSSEPQHGAWDAVRRASLIEMAGGAGNETAVRRFCQALVNARGARGETLFYVACGAGCTSLVKALLAHGGDFIHATNDAGKTAMHAATAAEDHAVCDLLMRHTDLPVQGEAAKCHDGSAPVDCCGVAFRDRLLELSKKSSFCCFLSHYKSEAFAEARWLHDELERLLGRKVCYICYICYIRCVSSRLSCFDRWC